MGCRQQASPTLVLPHTPMEVCLARCAPPPPTSSAAIQLLHVAPVAAARCTSTTITDDFDGSQVTQPVSAVIHCLIPSTPPPHPGLLFSDCFFSDCSFPFFCLVFFPPSPPLTPLFPYHHLSTRVPRLPPVFSPELMCVCFCVRILCLVEARAANAANFRVRARRSCGWDHRRMRASLQRLRGWEGTGRTQPSQQDCPGIKIKSPVTERPEGRPLVCLPHQNKLRLQHEIFGSKRDSFNFSVCVEL